MGSVLLAQKTNPSSAEFSRNSIVEEPILTQDQKVKIEEVKKETEIERQKIKEDKTIPNGNRGKLIKALHLKESERISEIMNSQKP